MPLPAQADPVVVEIRSVHRGQNDKDNAWLLDEHVSELVQNLDISRVGGRRRRNGVSSIGARSDSPGGLWAAFDANITENVLFGIHGGSVYRFRGTGLVEQKACGVSLTAMLHMANQGRWSGRTTQYITSAQADDSGLSLASRLLAITDNNLFSQTASMAPRCAVWWQDRLWCAGNVLAQDDDTLWWSELGDGLRFSLTNTHRVEPGVGGRLTALLPLRGPVPQLLLFKERAIVLAEVYWGSSSALIPVAADALDVIKSNIRLVVQNAGCVATLSVQYVPGAPGGDVYFLSSDGIRALPRGLTDVVGGASVPVSDPIRTTIERVNFKFAHKAVSAVFQDTYHLAVPLDGATENTHVLSFDFVTQAWFLNTFRPKAFARARLNEEQDRLWMQYSTLTLDCSNSGTFSGFHLFKAFAGQLDPSGVPVIYHEQTRALDFGQLRRKKTWDWVDFTLRNENTETCLMTTLYNVDQRGWVTHASLVFAGAQAGVILGTTPLPWGVIEGAVFRQKIGLADLPPGYFIQVAYLGQSDGAVPTVLGVDVAARYLNDEFDNTIT